MEQLLTVLLESLEGCKDWNDYLDRRAKLQGLRATIDTVNGLAEMIVFNELNKE